MAGNANVILGVPVLKLFLASIAAVGLLGASALAADLPVKAPVYDAPTAAPPYNWSGPYLGANIGGAWTSGSLNIPGNNLYGGIAEFIGGFEAGYNFQAGHLLFGVEGDFDWAAFDHLALPAPTLGSVSQHWISSCGPLWHRERPMAYVWQGGRRLGAKQRYAERSRPRLERVQH